MEDIEKPHIKHKEITNDWNYNASCTLTSLPVWDLENFKHFVFVAQTVQMYEVFVCVYIYIHVEIQISS
jgi:hypothetical protein